MDSLTILGCSPDRRATKRHRMTEHARTQIPLSVICETAVIIDIHNAAVYSYAKLVLEPETPGLCHSPLSAASQIYLVCWPSGLVAQLVSRQAPEQLQPSLIEALYGKATSLKPCTEGCQRKGGR